MWELSLLHDAIVNIDLAQPDVRLNNLDSNLVERGVRTEMVGMFKDQLDVHRPGSIIWAGHSFGSATMVQFLKHTYYGPPAEEKNEFDEALFNPKRPSALVNQITNQSVTILLDMWCLPLRSRATRWLWDKPMPCYDVSRSNPAGGDALLTVLSEAFHKWTGNMGDTKLILNGSLPEDTPVDNEIRLRPHAFYPETSAHLSQSDFNLLFPWLTSKVLKTKDPERLLNLNVRAILQLLRINNVDVAPTNKSELEADGITIDSGSETDSDADGKQTPDKSRALALDARILDPNGGVPGWFSISTDSAEALHTEEDYKTPSAELDEAQALELVSDKA
jgi:platelet-activating factor acetylhydrolase